MYKPRGRAACAIYTFATNRAGKQSRQVDLRLGLARDDGLGDVDGAGRDAAGLALRVVVADGRLDGVFRQHCAPRQIFAETRERAADWSSAA
jgi:hypothetical protein